MDFDLSDEQALLKDSLERFVRNDYDFDSRRRNLASERGFSSTHWQLFGELGWTAMPFPEVDGGLDGGAIELMLIMEQFGRGLVIEPYLPTIVLAGGALRRAGSEAQKSRWLAPLVAAEQTAALAFAEPGGRFDPWHVTTRAERDGEGWRLHGEKIAVLNARDAGLVVVPARTAGATGDRNGIGLFVVTAGTKGMRVTAYPTVDGLQAADLALDGVRVDGEALLGTPDGGGSVLAEVYDEALLAVSAEAVGVMSVLLEKTIDYTRNRRQFGVPIGTFQALQHRMVEMFMCVEQSRSLLYMAAMKLAAGHDDASRALAALKYQVGTSGRLIGEEAVQLHGGMGVTDELDVAHYFKRVTTLDLLFGNADHHLTRYTG